MQMLWSADGNTHSDISEHHGESLNICKLPTKYGPVILFLRLFFIV